jgi:hypothetical protein
MSTNDHDKSSYYYSGNRKISLIRDPELRLVKFKQETPAERSKLSQKATEFLPSESTVAHLNRYGAYIIRTNKDRSRSPEEITSVLQDLVSSEDNIEYASVAYRQGSKSPDPMFTTKELVARQKEGVTRKEMESILSKYNIRVVKEEKWQPGLLRLEAPAARSDHFSFQEVGYPACHISEDFFANYPTESSDDPNPNYHRFTDNNVDVLYTTDIVTAAALAIKELASN